MNSLADAGGIVGEDVAVFGGSVDDAADDQCFAGLSVSPPRLLVQCAGRVVRAAAGKDTAEVHDFHDHAVPISTSLHRRMPGYRTLWFTMA